MLQVAPARREPVRCACAGTPHALRGEHALPVLHCTRGRHERCSIASRNQEDPMNRSFRWIRPRALLAVAALTAGTLALGCRSSVESGGSSGSGSGGSGGGGGGGGGG